MVFKENTHEIEQGEEDVKKLLWLAFVSSPFLSPFIIAYYYKPKCFVSDGIKAEFKRR